MRFCITSFFISLLLITTSCQSQQPTAQIHLGNGKVVLLMDSSDGARAVTKDDYDGFFDKVTASEISIQVKKSMDDSIGRDMLVKEYKSFIKNDLEDFTPDELTFMTSILQKMYRTVSEINPAILPDTLIIVKTKGRYYGEGVWYTRNNCIIIPSGELAAEQVQLFTSTMYHELFHVYSRLHPDKSAMLYKLIGFEAIGFENLIIPETLAERILYNPDGVNIAQKIDLLQEDSSTISAIPVIYSNHLGYTKEKKNFFGYLEFNLFQIKKQVDGKWSVIVKDDGFSSTLDLKSQPDFFRQIKDNTQYIIHPDEVLADNFSYIMQERDGEKISDKFSPGGKELLKNVEGVSSLTKE